MANESTRNFHAHGGNVWVVGGTLTFLPGAKVEGLADLLDLPQGAEIQLAAQKPSEATTVAALREDFNRLLAVLKASGLMASDEQQEQSGQLEQPTVADPTEPPIA